MKSESEFKAKSHGIKRLFNALGYSWSGLKSAFSEAGFRELCLLHGVLMVSLWFIPFSPAVKMILIFASFFSLICELFNTAIEACVDLITLDYHELAKRAKDVASAAQYTSLCLVTILWLFALFHL